MQDTIETDGRGHVAARMVLGTFGTLALLLGVAAILRPDMMMQAVHHMMAMIP